MDQNRYQPPRANLNARNREPGSLLKAVVYGAVIDIGGTLVGSFVFAFVYVMLLGLQGHPAEVIEDAVMNFDRWSFFGISLTLMGLSMSAIGGFICAAIANRPGFLAPGLLSLVSVTTGAMLGGGELPQQELMFFSALTVAAIFVGAAQYMRRANEPQTPPSAEP